MGVGLLLGLLDLESISVLVCPAYSILLEATIFGVDKSIHQRHQRHLIVLICMIDE